MATVRRENRFDKRAPDGELLHVKVSLPSALEEFVVSQVESGEFHNPSAVISEGLRLLRDRKEDSAMEEMRTAFAGVDSCCSKNAEPTAKDRDLIDRVVKRHRSGRRP